jgi:lycopene beta-cyclase
MTAYKMVMQGKFHKTILLLDENSKKTNIRTWCFWTKETIIWEPIISKKMGCRYVCLMKISSAT